MKKCPHCESTNSSVYHSHQVGGRTVRRRKCRDCGKRWKTFEVHAHEYAKLNFEQSTKES